MMNEVIMQGILIGVTAILLWFLRNYAKTLKAALINNLIQLAEVKIQGSKMGAEKKAWVIQQLKVIGIKVNDSIDKLIEDLVDAMNKNKVGM